LSLASDTAGLMAVAWAERYFGGMRGTSIYRLAGGKFTYVRDLNYYYSPGAVALPVENDGWLGSFYCPDPPYCSNGDAAIHRYNGTSWSWWQAGPDGAFETRSILVRMHFVRGHPQEGWGVDNHGDICRYANGRWVANLESAANAVWMNAPDDVWAAGMNGLLLNYDGTSWKQVALPPAMADVTLTGISFSDATHGMAIGVRETVPGTYEPAGIYLSGGTWIAFTPQLPPGVASLYASGIFMTGPAEAWIYGSVLGMTTGYFGRLQVSCETGSPGVQAQTRVADPLPGTPASLPAEALVTSVSEVEESGGVRIDVGISGPCRLDLRIYDAYGGLCWRVKARGTGGKHSFLWDKKRQDGEAGRAGMHTARVYAANGSGRDADYVAFPLVYEEGALISSAAKGEKGKLIREFAVAPPVLNNGHESIVLHYNLSADAMTEVLVYDLVGGASVARYPIAVAGELGGREGPNTWILGGIGTSIAELPAGSLGIILTATAGRLNDTMTAGLIVRDQTTRLAGSSSGPGSVPPAGPSAGAAAGSSGPFGQPALGTAADSGSHDNGVDNGKNPKDFTRDSNPGNHKVQNP